MEKEFEKLNAILDSDKTKVRQNLGKPQNGGETVDIYKRNGNALVLFYQWKYEHVKVVALILYASSGEILYAKNIKPMSRETYQFLLDKLNSQKPDSTCVFNARQLEKLCGIPITKQGSGVDVWFYATDFGALVSFQVLSGEVMQMELLYCLDQE